MENLSRVSRRTLWEAFLSYGKVMDVFIHRTNNQSVKASTFAFVRYKKEAEMLEAIDQGNGRRVDGWLIRVKKASYGWGDRKRVVQDWQKKHQKSSGACIGSVAFRDNRSYREVLLGDKDEGFSKTLNPIQKGITMDTTTNMASEDHVNKPKRVEYDLDIPKAEMEWLNMSTRGSIKEGLNLMKITKEMKEAGCKCQISPLDSIAVLLTFQSKEELLETIKEDRLKPWFDDIAPWKESTKARESFVWVLLEEVPLQVWHPKVFQSLGNSWGQFVCLDECTVNRSRLDVARMLIRVESSLHIPSSVSVAVGGSTHRIIVAVEDTPVVGVEDGVSGNTVDELARNSKVEALFAKLSSLLPREKVVPAAPIFGSPLGHETHHAYVDYGSRLSVEELIGEPPSKLAHAQALVSLACHVNASREIVGQAIAASNDFVRGATEVGPCHGSISLRQEAAGQIETELGLESQSVRNACGSLDGSLLDTDLNPLVVEVSNGHKNTKNTTRRRRKSKKSLAHLVYGAMNSTDATSDESIADEEIENRNLATRKKAEAT